MRRKSARQNFMQTCSLEPIRLSGTLIVKILAFIIYIIRLFFEVIRSLDIG